MADIKRINGYDIKDETARNLIDELDNNKADKAQLNGLASTAYVDAAIKNAEISGGGSGEGTNISNIMYTVDDFGAVGDGRDSTEAFRQAIAFMNGQYAQNENYLNDTLPKGKLIVPQGLYVISDTMHITGNYDFEMYGAVHYEGEGGTTMFIIGLDEENICGNNYIFNASSKTPGVLGFELVNLLSCFIKVKKLSGFEEAMRCIGKHGLGWCGNYSELGIFRDNQLDIHVTLIDEGWPNANIFVGGFFYKNREALTVDTCIKLSSLDGTGNIDSNDFQYPMLEEGKPNCLPIIIEKGNDNKFTNVRVEQLSDVHLAHIYTANNVIEWEKGVWNSSVKIIGRNGEVGHTHPVNHPFGNNLKEIYDTGNLGNSLNVSGGRFYNPKVLFGDRSNETYSCISNDGFSRGDEGLVIQSQNSLLATRIKVNEDNVFNVDFNMVYGAVDLGIRCLDANGNQLSLVNNDIDGDDWYWNMYAKTGSNLEYMANDNLPFFGTGAYQTPYQGITNCFFEVHPDVAYVEVFIYPSGSALVRDFKVYSNYGTAQVIPADDVNDYIAIGGNVYRPEVGEDGTLRLTNL